MRQRAIQRGLRLNEYGLFRSHEETRDPANLRLPCLSEEEIFAELGSISTFIPPEMREDRGESSPPPRRKRSAPPDRVDRTQRLPAQPLQLERRPRLA